MDIGHTNFITVAFETMLKAPQVRNMMTICMYTNFLRGGFWLAHRDWGKKKQKTSLLHAKNDPWIQLHSSEHKNCRII